MTESRVASHRARTRPTTGGVPDRAVSAVSSAKPLPLAGQIVAVTGAGSGIGAATAKAFAAVGAEVALLDVNDAAAEEKAKSIGGAAVRLTTVND